MKTVKKFGDGEPIPDDAKYVRSEWIVVGYDDPEHPMLDSSPIRRLFHWYETAWQKGD